MFTRFFGTDMDDATRPRLKRDTETETLTLIQKIHKLMKKMEYFMEEPDDE